MTVVDPADRVLEATGEDQSFASLGVDPLLADALAVVHGGRSAVVSVHLPPAQAAP